MYSQEEFIHIIKENEGIIYKVARIYSNNTENQKDLYQEIVYQLWKSRNSFKGHSKVSTWIYRIALNTSIAFLKEEKKNVGREPIDHTLSNKIDQVDTATEEQLSIIYEYIQQLNIIEKGIILLSLEGKNYDEIAEITGFTSTNVGTRLNRIKVKLKSNIKK